MQHLSASGFYLSHKCIFCPLNVGSSMTRLHTLCCIIIICYCRDFFYLFILRSETLWSLMSGISCSSSPSLPPSLVCRHTTQGQMGGEAPDVSLINSHLTELKTWSVSATEMLIVCNPAINCTVHLCVVVGSYVNKRLNQQQAKWEQGKGQSLKVMQQI